MKPCAFEMIRPRELAEALELLETHGDDARLIAGGQSLVPMMNLRMAAPAILIDLNTVNGLSGVRRDGDTIRIGAMTRQQSMLDNELIRQHVPLMAEAVRHIGHYSTRSRGTVGGSLANAELVVGARACRGDPERGPDDTQRHASPHHRGSGFLSRES